MQGAPTAEDVLSGKRRALGKAITLIESNRSEDEAAAQELLQALLPHTGKSIRVGITGSPGVGKSTFIEALGMQLVQAGHRVAVLAIDPSSPVGGGSILGDKTRMEELSRQEAAFIRPSPAGNTLGGVARRTQESKLLCEAAGYDVIIIETVGVGQSEFQVASMVDFFLVLMLPSAGDELQGLKKGIMELADALVINKADGDTENVALRTQRQYTSAVHLFSHDAAWTPPVLTCSALQQRGIAEVWQTVEHYTRQAQASGRYDERRASQRLQWFHSLTQAFLESFLAQDPEVRALRHELQQQVTRGEVSPYLAARRLVGMLRGPSTPTPDHHA